MASAALNSELNLSLGKGGMERGDEGNGESDGANSVHGL